MTYNSGINEIYEWYNAISIEELYKIEERCEDEFIKNFAKEMIKLKRNKYININKENQSILKTDCKSNAKWLVLTTKKSLISFCYYLADENENEILIDLKSLDENNILEIHIVNSLYSFSGKPKYIYTDIEALTERITSLVK